MKNRLMIHSDGTGPGTVILDDDGNKVANVARLDISIEADGFAEATLEVKATAFSVDAGVASVEFHCPACSSGFEHSCHTTVGGGTSSAWAPMQHVQPTYQPSVWNFEICGVSDGTNICYMNKNQLHGVHFDVKNNVQFAPNLLPAPISVPSQTPF